MRQERITQATIFEVFAEHEIGRELKAISQWLDEHRGLLSLAAGDLRRHGIQETGRHRLQCATYDHLRSVYPNGHAVRISRNRIALGLRLLILAVAPHPQACPPSPPDDCITRPDAWSSDRNP